MKVADLRPTLLLSEIPAECAVLVLQAVAGAQVQGLVSAQKLSRNGACNRGIDGSGNEQSRRHSVGVVAPCACELGRDHLKPTHETYCGSQGVVVMIVHIPLLGSRPGGRSPLAPVSYPL